MTRLHLLVHAAACIGCGARTPLWTDATEVAIDGGATSASCVAAPSATVLHAPKVMPQGPGFESDMTGDGRLLYVVDAFGGIDGHGGDVVSLDPCTGAAQTLGYTNLLDQNPLYAFDGAVYAALANSSASEVDIWLGGRPLAAQSPFATVTASIAAFAVDAENVYGVGEYRGISVTPIGGATELVSNVVVNRTIPVVDDSFFYVALPQGIEKLDKEGNVVDLLFAEGTSCADYGDVLRVLAGDETNLYVSTSSPYALWSVPKDGSTPVELTTLTACGPLTVDDTYVYFVELATPGANPATIERLPKRGGTKESLSPARHPNALYVDAMSVYWSGVDDGVLKLDK